MTSERNNDGILTGSRTRRQMIECCDGLRRDGRRFEGLGGNSTAEYERNTEQRGK